MEGLGRREIVHGRRTREAISWDGCAEEKGTEEETMLVLGGDGQMCPFNSLEG
jgi:hypothetical protein